MDRTEDVAALRCIIDDIETGFNTNDAELAVAHFTDDASAVNVGGALLQGREALLDAHREGGEPLDVGHAMIALYVFVRDDGAWRVAARQNTLVRA